MNAIILSDAPAWRLRTAWQLENLGPEWRCTEAASAPQAYCLLTEMPVELAVLTPCPAARALLQLLTERPLLSPPYLLGDGFHAPDGPLPDAAALPGLLRRWMHEGTLPSYHALRLPEAERLARGMLHALGIPQRLSAWDFLPEAVALTVVHPPLLNDLTHGLYPLVARRHDRKPAAVERSLRLCIEATWIRGDLAGLERFFGSSVDPDKGKPTNREFLCRVQERVTFAARRLG